LLTWEIKTNDLIDTSESKLSCKEAHLSVNGTGIETKKTNQNITRNEKKKSKTYLSSKRWNIRFPNFLAGKL
jgi:hypothetical protein